MGFIAGSVPPDPLLPGALTPLTGLPPSELDGVAFGCAASMFSAPFIVMPGASTGGFEGTGGTLAGLELQALAAMPSIDNPTTCIQRIILTSGDRIYRDTALM